MKNAYRYVNNFFKHADQNKEINENNYMNFFI